MKSTLLTAFASLFLTATVAVGQPIKLLNVSYDPTRELYEELNPVFAEAYKKETGKEVTIEQSHGGGSKQVRAVIDGLDADVVTQSLAYDISAIEKAGLISAGWQKRLPENSSPYTSTIVFVVRKGNPKQIKDWNDLVRDDVKIVVPNPKTSGGARWAFLAAYAYGGGVRTAGAAKPDESKGTEYIQKFYKNVPVLDTGARGATISFTRKAVGDVLPTWENEAYHVLEEFAADGYEIVYPSVSILTEPPVAVVDKNVDRKGTRAAAEAYLKFLYTPTAQAIILSHHYRARDKSVEKPETRLPAIPLFTIDEVFGGWDTAQAKFFADGGVFDQIYKEKPQP